jgi:hypothetical protein
MYCLLTQETQKKAKAAKKLFYGRSRRHHAAKNCKKTLLRPKPQAPLLRPKPQVPCNSITADAAGTMQTQTVAAAKTRKAAADAAGAMRRRLQTAGTMRR